MMGARFLTFAFAVAFVGGYFVGASERTLILTGGMMLINAIIFTGSKLD